MVLFCLKFTIEKADFVDKSYCVQNLQCKILKRFHDLGDLFHWRQFFRFKMNFMRIFQRDSFQSCVAKIFDLKKIFIFYLSNIRKLK